MSTDSGSNIPGLGRITGYAEAHKDLLTGKSGRDRQEPRILRLCEGAASQRRRRTFRHLAGRAETRHVRALPARGHMDGLDDGLRSNREAIGEGPLLETAQGVLRAIFNAVAPHDRLEAKSKEKSGTTVSAKSVGIATVAQHRDKFECEHAIVVGPAFPTTEGDASALGAQIKADRDRLPATGAARTITLITVDELARLRSAAARQAGGLQKIRELFRQCCLPDQSAEWVESIRRTVVEKPPIGESSKRSRRIRRNSSRRR